MLGSARLAKILALIVRILGGLPATPKNVQPGVRRTLGNVGETSGNVGETSGNVGETSGNVWETSGERRGTSGVHQRTSRDASFDIFARNRNYKDLIGFVKFCEDQLGFATIC